MTVGELAHMFRHERGLQSLDLVVVPVEGWSRGMYFDETGLPWTNPSPNMRSLTQAVLYPGIGLLETTNVSVGRGTDTPFEVVGAPWMSGRDLAAALSEEGLAAVAFVPIEFTPSASKFAGERCGGVNVIITDRGQFEPLRVGLAIAGQLRRLYPDEWRAEAYLRLLGDRAVFDHVLRGARLGQVEDLFAGELESFRQRREQYLLY
jgi:uncharacterized protein YbbC (DUF1343 family)